MLLSQLQFHLLRRMQTDLRLWYPSVTVVVFDVLTMTTTRSSQPAVDVVDASVVLAFYPGPTIVDSGLDPYHIYQRYVLEGATKAIGQKTN